MREHVEYLLERWADEDAAGEVGDGDVAARSLALAALSAYPAPADPRGSADRSGRPVPGTALGLLRLRVLSRVHALQATAPISRWTASWPAAALVAFTVLAGSDTAVALARCLHALHP